MKTSIENKLKKANKKIKNKSFIFILFFLLTTLHCISTMKKFRVINIHLKKPHSQIIYKINTNEDAILYENTAVIKKIGFGN